MKGYCIKKYAINKVFSRAKQKLDWDPKLLIVGT